MASGSFELESRIEGRLVRGVRAAGGLCWKVTAERGAPDRIAVLPGGRVVWIELKRPGGTVARAQEYQHRRLRALGHEVLVLRSRGEVDGFLAGLAQGDLGR